MAVMYPKTFDLLAGRPLPAGLPPPSPSLWEAVGALPDDVVALWYRTVGRDRLVGLWLVLLHMKRGVTVVAPAGDGHRADDLARAVREALPVMPAVSVALLDPDAPPRDLRRHIDGSLPDFSAPGWYPPALAALRRADDGYPVPGSQPRPRPDLPPLPPAQPPGTPQPAIPALVTYRGGMDGLLPDRRQAAPVAGVTYLGDLAQIARAQAETPGGLGALISETDRRALRALKQGTRRGESRSTRYRRTRLINTDPSVRTARANLTARVLSALYTHPDKALANLERQLLRPDDEAARRLAGILVHNPSRFGRLVRIPDRPPPEAEIADLLGALRGLLQEARRRADAILAREAAGETASTAPEDGAGTPEDRETMS